ncbi:hypothetical protein TRICI_000275 [Trichomonascus ciferrii]|uniref:Uncharacterized protein n=1 Tax=Trichomonascus ciferrii TaxID=44093 RepID=A0A642VDX0_9ASCO|nr:hypothetical protein TRICI_000275 [Trichomonascus ciferrii]
MVDRGTSDGTVTDKGESNSLEKPLNGNYLCLTFSEKGWKSKIEAAMSASKSGDGDFVVEFIECKGKLMDYIYWYFKRFIHRRHLLTADFDASTCIAVMPGPKHESGVDHCKEELKPVLVPDYLSFVAPWDLQT